MADLPIQLDSNDIEAVLDSVFESTITLNGLRGNSTGQYGIGATITYSFLDVFPDMFDGDSRLISDDSSVKLTAEIQAVIVQNQGVGVLENPQIAY